MEGTVVDERIAWDRLSEPEFTERVDALFVRMYQNDPEREATIINGRGGDDGHDIDIHLGDVLEQVVQLKNFLEGFSKTRRQQIRASFNAAMKSNPEKWLLVVPADLTTCTGQRFR
jgi:hypothetical protein